MIRLSVTQRLSALVGLPLIVLAILLAVSMWAFSLINQGVGRIYDDRVLPLTELKEISEAYANTVNAINKADNGLMVPIDAEAMIRDSQKIIKDNWDAYIRGDLNRQERQLVADTEALFGEADELIEEAAQILVSMGDTLSFDEYGDTLITDYNGDLYEYIDPITEKISSLMELQLNIARQERENAQSIFDTVFNGFIIAGIVVFIAVIGAGYLVARSVIVPLSHLQQTIEKVDNNKDLTVLSGIKLNDEIGDVAAAFDRMVARFSQLISDVHNTSDDLKQYADNLTKITIDTRKNVDIQSAETDAVAGASSEMSNAINEVSSNAHAAAEAAREADSAATVGGDVIKKTVRSVSTLEGSIGRANEIIERVQKDSTAIGSVLDVIRGISEQTNLLALNAAIEAARAGEQGRGFAVVADEVRALARRTQESTQEIQEMIERLQNGIAEAVQAIGQGRSEMGHTVEQTTKVSRSLATVAQAVAKITQMNSQIAHATVQQNQTSEEISNKVMSIAEAGRSSKNQVEGVHQSGDQVQSSAAHLSTIVDIFKIK